MVREQVFVCKGGSDHDHMGKNMSVGKGKVISVNLGYVWFA